MRPRWSVETELEKENVPAENNFAGWSAGVWLLRVMGIVVIALGISVGTEFADLAGEKRGWVFLLTGFPSIAAGCVMIFTAEIPKQLLGAVERGSGGVIWFGRLFGAVVIGLGIAIGINQASGVAYGSWWWFTWAGLPSVAIGILLIAVCEILEALRKNQDPESGEVLPLS